jgi:hypothetical protein
MNGTYDATYGVDLADVRVVWLSSGLKANNFCAVVN